MKQRWLSIALAAALFAAGLPAYSLTAEAETVEQYAPAELNTESEGEAFSAPSEDGPAEELNAVSEAGELSAPMENDLMAEQDTAAEAEDPEAAGQNTAAEAEDPEELNTAEDTDELNADSGTDRDCRACPALGRACGRQRDPCADRRFPGADRRHGQSAGLYIPAVPAGLCCPGELPSFVGRRHAGRGRRRFV